MKAGMRKKGRCDKRNAHRNEGRAKGEGRTKGRKVRKVG